MRFLPPLPSPPLQQVGGEGNPALIQFLFLFIILLGFSLCAHAENLLLNNSQQNRFTSLTTELRCVVCQNQSLAESNAPLAADLRQVIAEQIRAGQSDAQIKDYLVDRYGEFILYRPVHKPKTWILWYGPYVLLAGGLVILLRTIRRQEE